MKVVNESNLYRLKGAVALAAVGVSSWFGGCYYERTKQTNLQKHQINPIYIKEPTKYLNEVVPARTGDPENRLTEVQRRTAEIMKHGFPSMVDIRSYDDFVLSYDRKNKIANWVLEHLTPDRVFVSTNDQRVDRSKCDFREDLSFHEYFRATNKDYLGSGFDRGHLAAAGNHKKEQRHCDQTFVLSNISPQVGNGFNRHSWNRLEKYVRKLTKTYPNVYVCTGPLFLPRVEADGKKYIKYQVIGKNEVAVPTHFFKIVVMEAKDSTLHVEAYVMPNQPIDDNVPLTAFQVPPDAIERHAGILLMDSLKQEKIASVNGKAASIIKKFLL